MLHVKYLWRNCETSSVCGLSWLKDFDVSPKWKKKPKPDVIGTGAFATKWRLFVNSTYKDEGIFTSLNMSVMDKHQDESLDPLYLHYASS